MTVLREKVETVARSDRVPVHAVRRSDEHRKSSLALAHHEEGLDERPLSAVTIPGAGIAGQSVEKATDPRRAKSGSSPSGRLRGKRRTRTSPWCEAVGRVSINERSTVSPRSLLAEVSGFHVRSTSPVLPVGECSKTLRDTGLSFGGRRWHLSDGEPLKPTRTSNPRNARRPPVVCSRCCAASGGGRRRRRIRRGCRGRVGSICRARSAVIVRRRAFGPPGTAGCRPSDTTRTAPLPRS